MNTNFTKLVRQLAKHDHDVELEANTHDVKVYDNSGRKIAWINGAEQDSFVLYDVDALVPEESSAIEDYACLPVGDRE